MGRQKYNIKILSKLAEIVATYPDLRFGQILVNAGIIQYERGILCDGDRWDLLTIDPFYEESEDTWERMKDKYKSNGYHN